MSIPRTPSLPLAVGIIPARFGAQRFPGKCLAPLHGVPLIAWVIRRTRMAKLLSNVRVATDDVRIADAARHEGAEVVMTRPDHPSGTDRVAEAAHHGTEEIIVNIQGDEPLIEPEVIDALVRGLHTNPHWHMATAATALSDPSMIRSPNVVKVVTTQENIAMYFSRSIIPWPRDITIEEAAEKGMFQRHMGIYAYRRSFLDRLVSTPPTLLENTEKLEQLRALHLGAHIGVIRAHSVGIGVDHPEDIPLVETLMKEQGLVP